jgi:hypothetical protein
MTLDPGQFRQRPVLAMSRLTCGQGTDGSLDAPLIDPAHVTLECVALHRRPYLEQFLNQQSLGWPVNWRQKTLDRQSGEKRDGLVAAREEALSGKAGG